jgi:hypothetical protein
MGATWRLSSGQKLLIGLFLVAIVVVGGVVVLGILLMTSRPTSSRPSVLDDYSRREELLHRAIVSAGESCDEVVQVYDQGGRPDLGDFWNARCHNGNAFSVRWQASGEVQVLSCETMKLVAKTNCFESFAK